jgi:EAL domain-containing protein (putative c-di-GMP-specific phosphodiesterase class I)
MLTDPPTASITEAVVSMAHALGLSVVAEGIEERAQLELLERYGCDQAQGFYFSSAVPAPRFAELLRDRR